MTEDASKQACTRSARSRSAPQAPDNTIPTSSSPGPHADLPVPADRVPYPCRVWTRAGLNCPPGFLALVEDDDNDDDDDDPPTPWQAVGRRLKDRLPPNADRALQMAELALVFAEVREILGRRTVLQRAAWAQFDVPQVVPRLVRTPTGGRPWKEEVAIAAVIALAGYAVYRGLSVSPRRLAPGTAILGAAGIIAPFLAGQEQEPKTLSLVPAFALRQYQERRRRRLEEEVGSRETGELIFEEPPGGGAPAAPTHYMWYTADKGFQVLTIRNQQPEHYPFLVTGTEEFVQAELARLTGQGHIGGGFNAFYIQIIKSIEAKFGTDPLGGLGTTIPGSEEESANEEQVDESVPVGNRW